jgi:hypothetical protein
LNKEIKIVLMIESYLLLSGVEPSAVVELKDGLGKEIFFYSSGTWSLPQPTTAAPELFHHGNFSFRLWLLKFLQFKIWAFVCMTCPLQT